MGGELLSPDVLTADKSISSLLSPFVLPTYGCVGYAECGKAGIMYEQRLETTIQVSPNLAVAMFLGAGVVLSLTSDYWPASPSREQILMLPMLFYALSLATWLLVNWAPQVSRWFAVTGLASIVFLGSAWLDIPELLLLTMAPVSLAAVLISPPVAAGVATAETIIILTRSHWAATPQGIASVVLSLIGIWIVFGAMYAILHSAQEVTHYSLSYFEQARAWLESARDRQEELNRTVEELAQTNLQLSRLHTFAQVLRQEAEDAKTTKEQFVANVSHEFRTPLNMIVGFCEMIVESPEVCGSSTPPKLLADLAVVLRNARHLSELVNDVLDLSQVEAAKMALTRERTSVQSIIEAALAAIRPLLDLKGLYIKTEIPDDLPSVFWDTTRIRQVLLNLLSNAGRLTVRGGIHLRVWRTGDEIALAVRDTGPGIAPTALNTLWQPFQKPDGPIYRQYKGTGLGLSISKQFVELHGGKIWVETEEGVGTTFFIHLPIEPPLLSKGDVSRWFSPYLHYEGRAHRPKLPVPAICPRYIVLETHDVIRRLLTRYLDNAEIVATTSLQEAVRESLRLPSQALLINDPAADQMLRSIEESDALPRGLPVISCHALGNAAAAGDLGIADYLVKPISKDTLLAALDRLKLQGKTVLLVDDEPDALRLFRRMLVSSGHGYRLLTATDGLEAMDVLTHQRPDVILLDLVMPRMSGFRFLAGKHADRSTWDIPVIVVSARDPSGQPIISNKLVVTQRDGLSLYEVLGCVEAISGVLSTARLTGDPTQRGNLCD